ncbi:serine hydrolase [Pseudonocardia sp. NPDC046786]|uniref:serine hydrolase n=1 Tax=Pseudonocardia sp. NPDC046786 TaxID=3155471 RepID=UPI0033C4DF03
MRRWTTGALTTALLAVPGLGAVLPAPVTAEPAGAPGGPSAAVDAGDLAGRVERLAAAHVGRSTPGAVVAVVDADGPLLLRAWGDTGGPAPLTIGSPLPVASVSKVVTALTALRLHHDGVLDLDAAITTSTGVAPVDRRDPGARTPVTGRHLLTHHSGLTEPLLMHPDPPGGPGDVTPLLGPWLREQPPVLDRPAGTGLHYSPLAGHALLGAAIERATGLPFAEAARALVLGPAGATTADFPADPASAAVVPVVAADDGWAAAPWPAVHERPAAGLTWSAADAAALLHALVADDGRIPVPVVSEALATAVRPPHGGPGHTQVFFEAHRAGVRVVEHAGANGVAWVAVLPEAGIGVFAAVPTDGADAMPFAPGVVDEVAGWAVASGRVEARERPPQGYEALPGPWPEQTRVVDPVGVFQERLFADRGPERALRTLSSRVVVGRDGDDLVIGDRRYAPAPGNRWCDPAGCIAGVRADGGEVHLLRGDRAMLEQTLVPAPWWSDRTVVGPVLVAGVLVALTVLGSAVRAGWRRRRGNPAGGGSPAGPGTSWAALTLLLVVAGPLLPVWPLLTGAAEWVPSAGPLVRTWQIATAAGTVAGLASAALLAARWNRFGGRRRWTALFALVVGAATQAVLVTWAWPV